MEVHLIEHGRTCEAVTAQSETQAPKGNGGKKGKRRGKFVEKGQKEKERPFKGANDSNCPQSTTRGDMPLNPEATRDSINEST